MGAIRGEIGTSQSGIYLPYSTEAVKANDRLGVKVYAGHLFSHGLTKDGRGVGGVRDSFKTPVVSDEALFYAVSVMFQIIKVIDKPVLVKKWLQVLAEVYRLIDREFEENDGEVREKDVARVIKEKIKEVFNGLGNEEELKKCLIKAVDEVQQKIKETVEGRFNVQSLLKRENKVSPQLPGKVDVFRIKKHSSGTDFSLIVKIKREDDDNWIKTAMNVYYAVRPILSDELCSAFKEVVKKARKYGPPKSMFWNSLFSRTFPFRYKFLGMDENGEFKYYTLAPANIAVPDSVYAKDESYKKLTERERIKTFREWLKEKGAEKEEIEELISEMKKLFTLVRKYYGIGEDGKPFAKKEETEFFKKIREFTGKETPVDEMYMHSLIVENFTRKWQEKYLSFWKEEISGYDPDNVLACALTVNPAIRTVEKAIAEGKRYGGEVKDALTIKDWKTGTKKIPKLKETFVLTFLSPNVFPYDFFRYEKVGRETKRVIKPSFMVHVLATALLIYLRSIRMGDLPVILTGYKGKVNFKNKKKAEEEIKLARKVEITNFFFEEVKAVLSLATPLVVNGLDISNGNSRCKSFNLSISAQKGNKKETLTFTLSEKAGKQELFNYLEVGEKAVFVVMTEDSSSSIISAEDWNLVREYVPNAYDRRFEFHTLYRIEVEKISRTQVKTRTSFLGRIFRSPGGLVLEVQQKEQIKKAMKELINQDNKGFFIFEAPFSTRYETITEYLNKHVIPNLGVERAISSDKFLLLKTLKDLPVSYLENKEKNANAFYIYDEDHGIIKGVIEKILGQENSFVLTILPPVTDMEDKLFNKRNIVTNHALCFAAVIKNKELISKVDDIEPILLAQVSYYSESYAFAYSGTPKNEGVRDERKTYTLKKKLPNGKWEYVDTKKDLIESDVVLSFARMVDIINRKVLEARK